MDIFVYILLLFRFLAYIIFAFVKIFWFVFVIVGVKILIRILRALYEYNSRSNDCNRDVDIIDLLPTDTVHGRVYSNDFDRTNVKDITSNN